MMYVRYEVKSEAGSSSLGKTFRPSAATVLQTLVENGFHKAFALRLRLACPASRVRRAGQ